MTSKADQVFEYIKSYKIAHCGNSPTVREIMAHFDMKSTSTGNYWLNVLVGMGRITRNGKRGIELVGYQCWMVEDGEVNIPTFTGLSSASASVDLSLGSVTIWNHPEDGFLVTSASFVADDDTIQRTWTQ